MRTLLLCTVIMLASCTTAIPLPPTPTHAPLWSDDEVSFMVLTHDAATALAERFADAANYDGKDAGEYNRLSALIRQESSRLNSNAQPTARLFAVWQSAMLVNDKCGNPFIVAAPPDLATLKRVECDETLDIFLMEYARAIAAVGEYPGQSSPPR